MAKEQDRISKAKNNRSRNAAKAKRENLIRWIGVGAVTALVAGVVIIGFVGNTSSTTPGANTTESHLNDGGYPTKGIDSTNLSWSPNPDSKAASTLVIWEDFQCPACRQFEQTMGSTVEALAANDTVHVEYRMATFLDNKFPKADYSSHRAINAFGCAIEAGFGQKYHDIIYINQPVTEGTGYTNEVLTDFAKTAGYNDVVGFGNCVNSYKYMKWASDSGQKFYDEGISGTPTVLLDGVEATQDAFKSPADFTAWITANKK
jgi:protein-disulfide isomerase